MVHLFTKENITFALSIFGSLGTLFGLIHTFFINRRHLQMTISGHVFGDTKMLVVYASFVNKSRLPYIYYRHQRQNRRYILSLCATSYCRP